MRIGRGIGNGEWRMGKGTWNMGNIELGMVNGELWNREWAMENGTYIKAYIHIEALYEGPIYICTIPVYEAYI